MSTQTFLLSIDRVSTAVGKAAAWLLIALTLLVCIEVVRRYALNSPSQWGFELSVMMYGTLFMLTGAYTLAQNGHVRGDFLYGSMPPRRQAAFDLVLYVIFFFPGIVALLYAGWSYAADSWAIREHSSITADGPPLYWFKSVIPLAGALVLLQGIAEVVRCVVCLRTGAWPERLADVEEIDVVKTQLEQSTYVDDDARRAAIASVDDIEEAAHQRAGTSSPNSIAHGRGVE
ncbi:MAG: TRAP transporter small permease subunit [Burkholderiales bacterium]|jgi:TRAP-type mannitol/chloroaromatic compound transport system permease small subunit